MEMGRYLGALDQGTTSTRFMVFERAGRVVAHAQKEHEQIYPRPGWVEHNPLELWHRTIEVMEEACMRAGLSVRDVASIGITNQRETAVVWDRHTGSPVYNAIVWQDTRVGARVAELEQAGEGERVRALTGLPLATYFSALKIGWILDHVQGARERAERGDLLFGNVDSFLLWQMTGGLHATDVTNASRTQLMNLATLAWDDELLALFGIPRVMLPEIRSSSDHFGTLTATCLKGVPLCGVLGDQHAALVGQTCFRAGQAKNTYGTGCFLLMNTGPAPVVSRHGLLTTVAYRLGKAPAQYALEGSVAVAGALVQWLRDNLGVIGSSDEVEHLAASVPDNGDVYLVPAFSGLYAPYWKSDARGVIAGLTRFANKGHLARAALEATAFQTRDVVQAMEADAGIRLEQLRVDGGMVGNGLLMQFQADLLDRQVLRPAMRETTALGAAFAAGLGCGFYAATDELAAHGEVEKTWLPAMSSARREHLLKQWGKAVERAFAWMEPAAAEQEEQGKEGQGDDDGA
jgi:glycerol kinase